MVDRIVTYMEASFPSFSAVSPASLGVACVLLGLGEVPVGDEGTVRVTHYTEMFRL